MTEALQTNALEEFDMARAVGPQLYRALRQSILSCELVPGTRISESEMAARYGVSRQPVREAFIKLADDGLVEVRPQRGTFVCKIVTAAVMDARFIREAIEADVVKLLSVQPSPSLVAELRQQIAAQRDTAGTDRGAFFKLDDQFHRTLAEAAEKPFAWSVIEGLKSQMDRVRQISAVRFPVDRLIRQHSAIVEAIASQDPDAAEAAVRAHLRGILDDLPKIQDAMPEYFDPPGSSGSF